MEEPITELVYRCAPYALIAITGVIVFLALMACSHDHARARVREFVRLRAALSAL